MPQDFRQIEWDDRLEDDCRRLARQALDEDVGQGDDWTTASIVPATAEAEADIVARKPGAIAGMRAAEIMVATCDARIAWRGEVEDGAKVTAGQCLATMSGPAASLLRAERPMLNILGHLSGVATLTAAYVDRVRPTAAGIYDTRKTLPGFRRLHKWAVRCGGGRNHRLDLSDGILIKDNHLAFAATQLARSLADAVRQAQAFRDNLFETGAAKPPLLIEVEVDTLDQLREALSAEPDIVLLDNMPPATLRAAVELRNSTHPEVSLEASGGISLEAIADIAAAGVDRISVGALTHSAQWLDIGLDWRVA